MTDPILPSATFARIDAELRARLSDDVSDPVWGEALSRWLLFRDCEDLVARVAPALSPQQRVYNTYYWAKRFALLHTKARGYDAGIEQQVFDVLATADCDPDWKVVETIDRRVEAEILTGPASRAGT